MFKIIRWFLYYIISEFLILFFLSFNYINKGNNPNLLNNYINDNRLYLALLLGLIFIPFLYFNYNKLNIKKIKTNIYKLLLLGVSLSLMYNVIGFYIDKLLNSNLYGTFDIKTVLISSVLIGPIIEEYLFRGIMYNEAKKIYDLNKSQLIITSIFALSHTTLIQIIYAFIIGYVLIKIYENYKSIKYCIIVHMASNLTTTIITLLLIKNNILINMFLFIIGLIIYYLLIMKNMVLSKYRW